MEQMIEQPQPPEGDKATTVTMSPLAAVCQYLYTNSAKKHLPAQFWVGCQGNLIQIAY